MVLTNIYGYVTAYQRPGALKWLIFPPVVELRGIQTQTAQKLPANGDFEDCAVYWAVLKWGIDIIFIHHIYIHIAWAQG
jgi:hypothetical protein